LSQHYVNAPIIDTVNSHPSKKSIKLIPDEEASRNEHHTLHDLQTNRNHHHYHYHCLTLLQLDYIIFIHVLYALFVCD